MIQTPQDYRRSIVLTGKDKARSPYGGMTREQLEASPLVFLAHITYDIEPIVNAWKLDHRLSVGRAGVPVSPGLAGAYAWKGPSIETSAYNQAQFPGIYTTPTSQLDLLDQEYGLINPRQIMLILPLSLMQQRNWHLNAKDNYGSIDNLTFTPETLPTYLHKLRPLWGIHNAKDWWDPEVVFHDAIPLDFVEMIVVANETMKHYVESLVGGRIPVLIGSKELYRKLAFKKLYRGEDRLNPAPPQYCYTGVQGEWRNEDGPDAGDVIAFQPLNPYTMRDTPEQLEDDYIWQKRLKLCGINEEYTPEKRQQLFQRIQERMQQLYFEDAPRTPVEDYPPWKYTPEYY